MEGVDRPLKVLLYAYKTNEELILQIIEQLEKIYLAFHGIQIYLYSEQMIWIHKPYIEQISRQKNLIYNEYWLQQIDVLLVDDLPRSDVDLLLFMMMQQIPVIVEQGVIGKFPEILLPEKTVETYAHMYLGQLPIKVTQFLRNLVKRKQIVKEAQALALELKNPKEGTLILKDAILTCEQVKGEKMSDNPSSDVSGEKQIEESKLKNSTDVIESGEKQLGFLGIEKLIFSKIDKGHYSKKESAVEKQHRLNVLRKDGMIEKVDLVIISYNTLHYLRECLQCIRLNTLYPYRIIVVDNGSTDGSVEFLRKTSDIQLIANGQNYGYAKACNQGILAGNSEFVVLLNTDIKVSQGWLKRLVELARSDDSIGVVGPKMVNEQGQIVGAGVTELGLACSSRGWLLPDEPHLFTKVEDCYSVGGACYLIRREALAKVGLFDENYFFYFEETDLSLRMLEKGYRVVYCPHVKILHYHEGSLDKTNRLERLRRNQYFESSQRRFAQKWEAVFKGALRREAKRDIVVFGLIPWHFRYQRPQQICSRLAKSGYRILYINNTCYYGGRLQEVEKNLYTYSPDGNSVVYHMLSNITSSARLVQSIYQVLEKLDMTYPILWVDVPYWEKIVQNFDRQYLIYNCMDSYADFADLRQYCSDIHQMEKEMLNAADLVFASSGLLRDKLRKMGKQVYLIPNGADCQHFQVERFLDMPTDLSSISQPIIGYYGAIADWLDLDLLKYAVQRLPQFSFVLIGEHTVDIEALRAYPNIYFLGEKAYQELPRYMKHFQVAMIPFKKNELTLSTNPVKLYEFLAAGKPVVSVDLPEIQAFADVVYIAKNYTQFVNYLREVGKRDNLRAKEKRKQAVIGEDWQDRVREMLRLMHEYEETLNKQSGFAKLIR